MLKRQFTRAKLWQGCLQPPLGGCVLKLIEDCAETEEENQPPLGGCVLKQTTELATDYVVSQPPLGGCVLKQNE